MIRRTVGGETRTGVFQVAGDEEQPAQLGEQPLNKSHEQVSAKSHCFLLLRQFFFEGVGFFFLCLFFAPVHTSGSTMRVKHLLTLATGLLQCLCFCGVLFGWSSLVFILKAEDFFSSQCANATDGAAARGPKSVPPSPLSSSLYSSSSSSSFSSPIPVQLQNVLRQEMNASQSPPGGGPLGPRLQRAGRAALPRFHRRLCCRQLLEPAVWVPLRPLWHRGGAPLRNVSSAHVEVFLAVAVRA